MEKAKLRLPMRRGSGPTANPILRVFVIAVLGGVSGSLFYAQADAFVGVVPLWLYVGGVYAGFVGAGAALIFAFLPGLREFVELTAVSRFALAMVSVWEPSVAETVTSSPFLNATLVVGGALVLRHLLRARLQLQDGERSGVAGLGRLRAD